MGTIRVAEGGTGGDDANTSGKGARPGDAFDHGAASGDPLADAVVLWTRVSAPPDSLASGDLF